MINTTDRYLISRILKTFLPVCLGLCFLFFVGASFRLLKEEDLSLSQVAMALPWALPFLLPYLIPMSFAATLTLIYGRLVADNEVLAFGSLGIPGRALAWPAILLGCALTLGCAWVNATVVPHAHQKRKEAMHAVFQQLFELREGEHLSRSFRKQRFDLYVRRYGPKRLEGIVLHYETRAGGDKTLDIQLVAREGRIAQESGSKRLVLVLQDVVATLVPREGDGLPIRVHLREYVQGISLGGRRRAKERDYGSSDLRAEFLEGRLTPQPPDETRAELALGASIELGTRTTLGLAPLLMALLAVPIPLWLRSRNALIPFALGMIAVCGLFFGPLLFGQFLAQALEASWPSYIGIPCSLLGAAGLAQLARRA